VLRITPANFAEVGPKLPRLGDVILAPRSLSIWHIGSPMEWNITVLTDGCPAINTAITRQGGLLIMIDTVDQAGD